MTHQQNDPDTNSKLAYLGFQLIKPAPMLLPYVSAYWSFRRDSVLTSQHEEYMHPRGGFGIVFNFGDMVWLDEQPLTQPIFLDGANTFSRRMGFLGTIDLLGIRFYEGGAYPFLAMPLSEVRNGVAVLDAVDQPESLLTLHARLYEAKSLVNRVDLLNQWLLSQLNVGRDREPIIPASLSMIRQLHKVSTGDVSIPDLAGQLAISQRQLERLYQHQVGISPKQYLQLLRIESARNALKAMQHDSTTQLAVDLGFYDQSHFIREFSAVVGMTPYRYLKRSQQRQPDSG